MGRRTMSGSSRTSGAATLPAPLPAAAALGAKQEEVKREKGLHKFERPLAPTPLASPAKGGSPSPNGTEWRAGRGSG